MVCESRNESWEIIDVLEVLYKENPETGQHRCFRYDTCPARRFASQQRAEQMPGIERWRATEEGQDSASRTYRVASGASFRLILGWDSIGPRNGVGRG